MNKTTMKALILAGGAGTRLRPYTITIPKPLLPIGEMSALEMLIRQLARDGIQEIRMTVAYKANLMQAMLGDGRELGVKIDYYCENQPLGTAGCLAMQQDWFDQDLLVCNGDLLTNVDFSQVLRFHRQAKADISLCVRKQKVPIPYGVVGFNSSNDLESYQEKPTLEYWVSMGLYVVSPQAQSLIPQGERMDMPDLHLKTKASGGKVQCIPIEGPWYDIGAFEDYNQACAAFSEAPGRFLDAPTNSIPSPDADGLS